MRELKLTTFKTCWRFEIAYNGTEKYATLEYHKNSYVFHCILSDTFTRYFRTTLLYMVFIKLKRNIHKILFKINSGSDF